MGLICGIKWYLHDTHCSVTSSQCSTDQANSPLGSKELFDLAAECGKRHTLLECTNDLLELQHAHAAKLRGKLHMHTRILHSHRDWSNTCLLDGARLTNQHSQLQVLVQVVELQEEQEEARV